MVICSCGVAGELRCISRLRCLAICSCDIAGEGCRLVGGPSCRGGPAGTRSCEVAPLALAVGATPEHARQNEQRSLESCGSIVVEGAVDVGNAAGDRCGRVTGDGRGIATDGGSAASGGQPADRWQRPFGSGPGSGAHTSGRVGNGVAASDRVGADVEWPPRGAIVTWPTCAVYYVEQECYHGPASG